MCCNDTKEEYRETRGTGFSGIELAEELDTCHSLTGNFLSKVVARHRENNLARPVDANKKEPLHSGGHSRLSARFYLLGTHCEPRDFRRFRPVFRACQIERPFFHVPSRVFIMVLVIQGYCGFFADGFTLIG